MEAHDHARQRTYGYTQGRQRPYARTEILGADPIVLTGEQVRSGSPTLGSYRASLDGYEVRVDGTSKGVLPGQVVVEPGTHQVEVVVPESGRVVARQKVRVRAGDGPADLGRLMREDTVRVAGGAGWQSYGGRVPSGPVLSGELHVPWLLGPSWEVIVHGEAAIRWPRPTLGGGLAVERILVPGTWQARAGLQLDGYLLGADGDPALLAPSLVPAPVVSLAWLPSLPVHARLSLTGGWLWYTDQGQWHNDWTWRSTLVVGAAF